MVKDTGSWFRQATDQEHEKLNGINPDPLLDFSSSLRLTSLHRRKLSELVSSACTVGQTRAWKGLNLILQGSLMEDIQLFPRRKGPTGAWSQGDKE